MPEPVRPFFNNQFIINDGKWYGIYFPGHPALLALGERFHLMHWVPTLSAALTVPLTFAVGRRVFGQRAALLALPLLAFSPFFILSSATLLGHSTAGLLLMAFVYSTLRVLERPERMVWWLAAGMALGWTGLTRPVSAAAFALPWLVLLAMSLRRSPGRRAWAGAALFCLIGVGSAALLGAYHMALSGNPLTTGYHTFGRITGMSFTQGALVAPAPYPSLFELGSTLARLNFWLLGWPVSLAFLPFFRRTREGVALLLAPVGVVLLFAVTTVPSINVVGPVHYAELIAPLVLVSASGIEELAQWVRTRLDASAGRVLALPIAATLCALVLYRPALRRVAERDGAGGAGALRSGGDARGSITPSSSCGRSGPSTSPRGAGPTIRATPRPGSMTGSSYVRDLGEERNRELMRFLPDRAPYWMGVRDDQLVLDPAPTVSSWPTFDRPESGENDTRGDSPLRTARDPA